MRITTPKLKIDEKFLNFSKILFFFEKLKKFNAYFTKEVRRINDKKEKTKKE